LNGLPNTIAIEPDYATVFLGRIPFFGIFLRNWRGGYDGAEEETG
jgi:hypothetical protein